MERVQPPRRLRGAGKVQEGGGVAPILREPCAVAAQVDDAPGGSPGRSRIPAGARGIQDELIVLTKCAH
jgi:hypothetical protein